MEQLSIRNLPAGTKAALRARAQQRHRSVEAGARDVLTRALEGQPVTIVDLLGTDEGADIEFEPEAKPGDIIFEDVNKDGQISNFLGPDGVSPKT